MAADRQATLTAALGRVGVWSFGLQVHRAAEARRAVATYEAQGARVAWIPESIGSKEIFSHAAILLAARRHDQSIP